MTGTGSTLATRFRWPATWRAFAAFLRRPVLPERMTGFNLAAVRATFALLALDVLASAVLIGVFIAIEAAGTDLPDNALDGQKLTASLIVLIALVAPVIEEVLFRSWLTGRPAVATVIKYAVIGGVVCAAANNFLGPFAGVAAGVIVLGFAIREFIRRRKWATGERFIRWFRYFYFASAVLFASAHLLNYQEGGGLLTVLVLPQFVAGLTLGYARVTYGLWSSILLHASFNSMAVALWAFGEAFG
jgi:membrane protease YdiL (CAAX protease family)